MERQTSEWWGRCSRVLTEAAGFSQCSCTA